MPDLGRTWGRHRQSRTVDRGTPISREIAQSLTAAAMRLLGASNFSADHTNTRLSLGDASKLCGATDNVVAENGYDRHAAGVAKLVIRAGFRCPCSKELEGSSPSARTDAMVVFTQVDGGFHVRRGPSWARGGHILGTLSGEYRACRVTATASKSSSNRSA